MKSPKFITIKLDWGSRIFLPDALSFIEDKRSNGGGVAVWRGLTRLLFDTLREAKKFVRAEIGGVE